MLDQTTETKTGLDAIQLAALRKANRVCFYHRPKPDASGETSYIAAIKEHKCSTQGNQQMSKALIAQILDAIKDAHYVDDPISLGHYHKAKVIRNALRCRTPQKRLSVIREALNAYRVNSWLTDTGQIRLVKDGKDILIIG